MCTLCAGCSVLALFMDSDGAFDGLSCDQGRFSLFRGKDRVETDAEWIDRSRSNLSTSNRREGLGHWSNRGTPPILCAEKVTIVHSWEELSG